MSMTFHLPSQQSGQYMETTSLDPLLTLLTMGVWTLLSTGCQAKPFQDASSDSILRISRLELLWLLNQGVLRL